jgi:glucosyl-dolichyl phosphate glucuronosyltransferase
MDLTIILCTYNRCDKLAEALESLAMQKANPMWQWEVLVVDNNSDDTTVDVYHKLESEFPVPLRYAFEPNLGLSYARNHGIREAQGRYVAFIEDDEIADEQWVESILGTFQDNCCDAVAGTIELSWRASRPLWLTDEILGFLGYLNYGHEQALTEARPPFGGNMAFSKAVFGKIGLFDTALGRKGRKLTGGDEIELFKHFLRAGFVGIYQPKAVTYHIIEKNRLKKFYFRKLHFYEGKLSGQTYNIVTGKKIVGVPLFVFRQLIRSVLKYASTLFDRGLNNSLRDEMVIWYFWGLIVGCFEQSCVLRRNLRLLYYIAAPIAALIWL